jgi:hypothetical protein
MIAALLIAAWSFLAVKFRRHIPWFRKRQRAEGRGQRAEKTAISNTSQCGNAPELRTQ